MKKIITIVLLMGMLLQPVRADSTLRITDVYASFLDEKVEVTRQVMEIDGGTSEKVSLEISTSGGGSSKSYKLVQYDGNTVYTIASSTEASLSFDPVEVKTGLPLYLSVSSNGQQTTRLLNFRINVGETSKQFPTDVYSEFGSGLVIDLSDKLPGCKLSFLPFAIPLTVRKYADGRVVLGLGLNYQDAKFWNNARQGKFPVTDDFESVRQAVLSEESEAFISKPKNMGLLFSVSGWAEGNVNGQQPMRGRLQVYAGTGWATGGQYAILTWDVTVTIGGSGAFDFALVYNEAESRRSFEFDRVMVGAIGALEAFGGIGLYSLAAVGIYGAASLGLNFELLPKQTIDSLILAGEIDFKVKVFGKSIVTFTLISGSHDFLKKKLTASEINFTDNGEALKAYLLSSNYGDSSGSVLTSGEMRWHGTIEEQPLQAGWEGDKDFAHLLAEDIYPDSHVQILNTGSSALPQMNIVFLGSDSARVRGNQSVLSNSYYDLSTDFLSDPSVLDDNGTADFEPYVWHDDIHGDTYLVWQDAVTEITEEMTLSEIAANTEVAFLEYWVGSSWWKKEVLTDYAGSGLHAAGATVAADQNGSPVVSWFTTSVEDPLGLSGEHEIWLAVRDELGKWSSSSQFTVSGNVTSVQNGYFHGKQTLALSMTDGSGKETVSLWQDGEKIWEKEGANGQFSFMGYNYRSFSWCQDGKLYRMDESLNESVLTTVPSPDYQLYGKFGSSTVMLTGRSLKDSEENAFALFSSDGGSSWHKVALTDIDSHALVDHLSVAYSNENEPIVVYSVQNYEANYDEARTLASTYFEEAPVDALADVPVMSLSGEDPRFTDTQCDLYIKARRANSHLSLQEISAVDPEDYVPGQEATLKVTVFNNGLYPLQQGSVYYNGSEIGKLSDTLPPGESTEIEVKVPIPADTGQEAPSYLLEASSRGLQEIESRRSFTLPAGHLEVSDLDHTFIDMKEGMTYTISNHGCTTKDYEIVIRDDERGLELSREKLSLKGGEEYNGTAVSPSGMYIKDGSKSVTIYVLYEGEDWDSSTVEPQRIKTVVTLEEIYGQPLPPMDNSNSNDVPPAPAIIENTPRPTKTPAPFPVPTVVPSETPEPAVTETPLPTAAPTPTPTPAPSAQPGAEEIEKEKVNGFPWWIVGVGLTAAIGCLLIFLFLLWKKKDEDEEDRS
ncbi:MAG: hypothetical protein IKE21_10010 [Erysipelotrichaceae bacterium]|nr:hypothetical protein [Erysipelotrichaceae bacterium]